MSDSNSAQVKVATGCVTPFFTAWLLMLGLGGLHHSVDARVPAFGYWQVFLVLFVIGLVRNFLVRPSA